MKLRYTSLLWAVAASVLLPAGLSAQTTREAPKVMPEKFQLLLQRSIFSRERPRSASSRTRTDTPRFTRPPAAPILTGIVEADEGFVAFLEDQRTGRTSLARIGQQLAEGRVESMTLSYLVLRPSEGGEPRRIFMGNTLSGDARPYFASASSPATSSGASTQRAAGGGPPSGPEDISDPAERLRRRRMAELGLSGGAPPVSSPASEPGGPTTGPGPAGVEGSPVGPPQMETPPGSAASSGGLGSGTNRTERRRRSQ